MRLDGQSPLVRFDQPSQPQLTAPAYNQSVTGQKLAADGYPDDWVGRSRSAGTKSKRIRRRLERSSGSGRNFLSVMLDAAWDWSAAKVRV